MHITIIKLHLKTKIILGISDLSYVGLQYPLDSMSSLVDNMPLWDKGYSIPLQELEEFDVPVLNMEW